MKAKRRGVRGEGWREMGEGEGEERREEVEKEGIEQR